MSFRSLGAVVRAQTAEPGVGSEMKVAEPKGCSASCVAEGG